MGDLLLEGGTFHHSFQRSSDPEFFLLWREMLIGSLMIQSEHMS